MMSWWRRLSNASTKPPKPSQKDGLSQHFTLYVGSSYLIVTVSNVIWNNNSNFVLIIILDQNAILIKTIVVANDALLPILGFTGRTFFRWVLAKLLNIEV